MRTGHGLARMDTVIARRPLGRRGHPVYLRITYTPKGYKDSNFDYITGLPRSIAPRNDKKTNHAGKAARRPE